MNTPATGSAGPTATLARFAADLRYEDLPPSVVRQLKRCLLDTFGVALFGSTLPWCVLVRELVRDFGARPQSLVWGTRIRTSPADAALANGTFAHAFEYDESHTASFFHPGTATLPAVAAVAERQGGVDGKTFLAALAAGYEVGIRVGVALGYGSAWRGFHNQGIVGPYCAAAGAGRVLGLDAEQMRQAIGTAGSQGGGLLSAQFGAMVKRLHAGKAVQAGVYGALLAGRGFTGIADILDPTPGGFLKVMSETPDPGPLTEGLGRRWETEKVGFKVYPAVGPAQTSIWGIGRLMAEHGLRPDDIAGVVVRGNRHLVVHSFWPYEPRGVTAAQINLPFLLTVMIHEGDVFVDQFAEDRIARPEYVAYSRRITAVADPVLDKNPPEGRNHVILEVTTVDGRVLRKEIRVRHGSEVDPLSDAEVVAKFERLARRVLPAATAALLREKVERVEELADVRELVDLLSVDPPGAQAVPPADRPGPAMGGGA